MQQKKLVRVSTPITSAIHCQLWPVSVAGAVVVSWMSRHTHQYGYTHECSPVVNAGHCPCSNAAAVRAP